MSGMESIVENWWNEGNGAYGPPAYNPLKKTVGAASIHYHYWKGNINNSWALWMIGGIAALNQWIELLFMPAKRENKLIN